RVRAVTGRMPRGVELHLVYNATPALLAGFEGTDEKELAAAVAGAFRQDAARAAGEGDGNEDDSQGRDGGGEGDGHGVTGGHVGQGGGNGRVGGGHGGTGGARVIGLQLDLDVPTRLLARYGRVLRETRALLPEGTLLSVT